MHACIKQATELLGYLPAPSWQGAGHHGLRRQGEHPQRRSGIGHDYWQFRAYTTDDAAHRIDWKRSARDDTLYVRQLEQEVPRTLCLHLDTHASMHYRSQASPASKYDTGLTLALTLGGWASQNLETVSVQGIAPRRYDATGGLIRLFQDIQQNPQDFSRLPAPVTPLTAGCHRVLLTDGYHKEALLEAFCRAGLGGEPTLVVLIHDEDEVTFPFKGRRLFKDDSGAEHTFGKAERLQTLYQQRYQDWRTALVKQLSDRHGRVWCIQSHTPLLPVLTAMVGVFHASS